MPEKICTNCDQRIDWKSEFCPVCGYRAPKKNVVRHLFIIIICLICLTIIVNLSIENEDNSKLSTQEKKQQDQKVDQKNPLSSEGSFSVKKIGNTYHMKSGQGLISAIATSQNNWKLFQEYIVTDNFSGVFQMMSDGKIIAIADGTKVKYLGKLEFLSGTAKIKILEGESAGMTGYTLESNLY